jgi:fructose-bisphosphate aldolase/6-deoxy-5-ketofructose 1-phosphate synthase
MKINIPADVPAHAQELYARNYATITKKTDRLLLFTADHKIEHLNKDFSNPTIVKEAEYTEHIFKIAAAGRIGALVTQLGLIAQYGKQYSSIPYIVKLNSKTDIIPVSDQDPLSLQLYTVDDIIHFQHDAQLNICGIGYTIYLGSCYEQEMLHEAAQAILQAHAHGLVAIIWMYPRGAHVPDEHAIPLIAGATGVAACLGADFVKIHQPESLETSALETIMAAAGKTKVIVAGGEKKDPVGFLNDISMQLQAGAAGAAVGRNIYQNTLANAVAMTQALSALIYDQAPLATAVGLLKLN